MKFDSKIPPGPLTEKWSKYSGTMPLVAPNNKKRMESLLSEPDLAGASAAANLGN